MFARLVAKKSSIADAPRPRPLGHASFGRVQAKLAVGAVDHPLETEADRVAEQILRQPESAVSGKATSPHARAPAHDTASEDAAGELRLSHGSKLDSASQAFFAPRFGYDFSHVRIHADDEAADSARSIGALAFTAGPNIVFDRGRYQPGTGEGRWLLAHELAHVVQQGQPSRVEGRGLLGPVIQRQPKPDRDDPNKTPHTVDASGKIAPGTTQPGKGEGVWRIPLVNLRKDPKAWAVVLIPNVGVPTVSDVSVDVLLHFHGHGAGYRKLQAGESHFAGVLKPVQLRDVDLYEAEQQLLSLAKTKKKFVIAVLPQGSEGSDFGNVPGENAALLDEVFARLIADGHLPKQTNRGNVIMSGHSGGGVPAMAAAKKTQGGRQDLLLFDAINFGCAEKIQQEIKGEKQVNRDGSPKMVCKEKSPCKSYEYQAVSEWVTKRIKAEAALYGSAKKLKDNGTRFRGFTHEPVDPKAETCSYGHWYGLLKADVDKTIDDLKASADVAAQLHDNFQVKPVSGKHEDVMAHGSLEAALGP